MKKEKEGDQDQPYVSLYRGCRPPRMYEYRLYLYVCDLDVALFHSWLQGVTSKSVKKSENSLLNPAGCFPRHCRQRDIRPGKGVKNCREDDCRGEGGGVLYGRGERDKTGLVRVGGFGTRRTRAAVPHSVRAGLCC